MAFHSPVEHLIGHKVTIVRVLIVEWLSNLPRGPSARLLMIGGRVLRWCWRGHLRRICSIDEVRRKIGKCIEEPVGHLGFIVFQAWL